MREKMGQENRWSTQGDGEPQRAKAAKLICTVLRMCVCGLLFDVVNVSIHIHN